MSSPHDKVLPAAISGTIFGVRFRFGADDRQLLTAMLGLLPPAWEPSPASSDAPHAPERHLSITREADGAYLLLRDAQSRGHGSQEAALEEFDREVRGALIFNATEHVFLHAGAVAWGGAGVLIPGATFSGKTTLVAALVQAGAEYYSDENAVIDTQGLLHPYPKPLSVRLREASPIQTMRDVGTIGGVPGQAPVPVMLVAIVPFRPGAAWRAEPLSPAEGVIALQQYAFRRSERPLETLRVAQLAAADASLLKGERGDAEDAAAKILELLAERSSTALGSAANGE